MRILHTVEFYYPSRGGSQEVVRQLSERMIAMGHDVTVATSWLPERAFDVHNGVKIKTFRVAGNQVRGYSGDTESYKDFLRTEKFDVIMNYAAQQWATDLFFEVMDEVAGRKIFVPCGFSGLHDPAYKNYFKGMPSILASYDSSIYLSPTYIDKIFADQHRIKNTVVIPNGADETEFLARETGDVRKELGIRPIDQMILHVGSFTGMKGQPEAMQIYGAANLSNSRLVLIGNVFDKKTYYRARLKALMYNLRLQSLRSNNKIIIRSMSRQQTVDAFKQADLFLFPSNIEASPLVLFEACAAKTPFLTSDVGNAQEIIAWTKGGQLMASVKQSDGTTKVDIIESAQILCHMLADKKLLNQLADDGHAAWKKKFTWKAIAAEYINVYKGK